MAKSKAAEPVVERRKKMDRRLPQDRRQQDSLVSAERRRSDRRKVPRRRQIDPTTCERDYTDAEVEFMNALDDYKRRSGRMFPTCSEILEVLCDLGYQKQPAQAQPSEHLAPSTSLAADATVQ